MYIKIKQDFLNPVCDDWFKFKSEELTSSYQSGNVLLEYRKIANKLLFKSQHTRNPFKIPPDYIRFSEIHGRGILLPHRDHGVKTGLNYYISADNDITTFYKTKSDKVVSIKYPNRKESNIYTQNDLIETDRFVASSNEAYLLDVSQIHSVQRVNPESRVFIGYLWANHSYEEVLESLE
jgi:hypothetical protein